MVMTREIPYSTWQMLQDYRVLNKGSDFGRNEEIL